MFDICSLRGRQAPTSLRKSCFPITIQIAQIVSVYRLIFDRGYGAMIMKMTSGVPRDSRYRTSTRTLGLEELYSFFQSPSSDVHRPRSRDERQRSARRVARRGSAGCTSDDGATKYIMSNLDLIWGRLFDICSLRWCQRLSSGSAGALK